MLAYMYFPYMFKNSNNIKEITEIKYEDVSLRYCVVVNHYTHPAKFEEFLIGTELKITDFKREHTYYGDYIYRYVNKEKQKYNESVSIIYKNILQQGKHGIMLIS